MVITLIDKAKELIENVGKEEAIIFFEKRIKELAEPKNFEEICQLSGFETAIQFIKGEV